MAERLSLRQEPAVPSTNLKITDLRVAVVKGAPMTCPILRIDTDAGISGLGEVRDGASPTYALMLKSRLLGENPLDVDRLFRKIKQFGGHARQAGGVCGVEMALWDIAGKVYDLPAYQLLGGKFRHKIRCYADTDASRDPAVTVRRLKERLARGFTFLKMDIGIDLLRGEPGLITAPLGGNLGQGGFVPHMFTGIEIPQKGIEFLADYVRQVREGVGYEVPLAADHFGHVGLKSAIRLGRALEPYNLAWLEDLLPWTETALWRRLTESIALPTCTGEDIYLKEGFSDLLAARAVDIIHPDLASSGGLLETKKIGDLAWQAGIPMAMHFAGTPISAMANVHCAAASENFLALENHSVDVTWWDNLVDGVAKPIVGPDGFIAVPEGPGLGVTLNMDVLSEHCLGEVFGPTEEWNAERSWDRIWS
jgi:L-alanine-DL-glutamate epimerase-like enolase superfamily enzyme